MDRCRTKNLGQNESLVGVFGVCNQVANAFLVSFSDQLVRRNRQALCRPGEISDESLDPQRKPSADHVNSLATNSLATKRETRIELASNSGATRTESCNSAPVRAWLGGMGKRRDSGNAKIWPGYTHGEYHIEPNHESPTGQTGPNCAAKPDCQSQVVFRQWFKVQDCHRRSCSMGSNPT
ncbi:hypothetical protein Pla52n_30890 [Stieleria varia]|uniref:Uncharacterized protein n=1 Tax=Stieleria varia TaxID=2528005 RepID=A0A5C6AYJ4_9BACT|nr:hypothetical protein Pla52n_30890 [Stieleria varia]